MNSSSFSIIVRSWKGDPRHGTAKLPARKDHQTSASIGADQDQAFPLLDKSLKYPVIWVSGPAGSGKTTLVSGYAQARGHRRYTRVKNFTQGVRGEKTSELRLATRTGRPAGDDDFVQNIEQITGRDLSIGMPGRPRKQS